MGNSIVYIVIIMFFFGGALYTGYILEHVFLVLNFLVYLGLLIALIIKKTFIVSWLHLPIGIYVVSYWLACIHAVDLEAAVLEASRVSSLIPLSLIMPMLPREKLTRLLYFWPWIGCFLVVAGVAFQLVREGRLESTLEYANALALLLLVSILISIMAFVKSQSKQHLLLMTINAAGLLLTFSRSVWILWLISVVVTILIIPPLRTKKVIFSLLASHLAGLMIAMLVKQDLLFFLNRVASIQTKTSEFQIRLVYWKDSIHMFIDYMWGGTGGGGWAVLQHAYQSQPYFVKFIHNHYVQVFLDAGLLGGLSWLALIALFMWNGASQWKKNESSERNMVKGLVVILSVMLLHAAFDFDLTFPLIITLLIYLLLLMPQRFKEIRVNRAKLSAAASLLFLFAFYFVWMGVGYHWKEQGIRAAGAHDLEYAQEQFERAERAIPWSSSILYESAKSYVRMGNITREPLYYEYAERELLKARLKVPDQKLYNDLLNDIKNK